MRELASHGTEGQNRTTSLVHPGDAFVDDGHRSAAELAAICKSDNHSLAGKLDKPTNTGVSHHSVLQAALAALKGWVVSGRAPAKTVPLALVTTPNGHPTLHVDDNGLATGGVRTPWMDAPITLLSGVGNSAATPMAKFMAMLGGVGEPFSPAKVAQLYPRGKVDCLARFSRALDDAIARGHILAVDRQEIVDVAALEFGSIMATTTDSAGSAAQ